LGGLPRCGLPRAVLHPPQPASAPEQATPLAQSVTTSLRTLSNMQTSKAAYTGRISRIVELLQGKWTVQILCAMREHPVRLSKLRREIPAASKKGLTASLRSLEAAGVVLRRDLSSSVLHVEYELADVMRKPLVGLLDHLAEWSKLYVADDSSMMPPHDLDSRSQNSRPVDN